MQIDDSEGNLFRITMHESIMMHSDILCDLSIRTLATLRTSNVVVTNEMGNANMSKFLTALNNKITNDIIWIECANI